MEETLHSSVFKGGKGAAEVVLKIRGDRTQLHKYIIHKKTNTSRGGSTNRSAPNSPRPLAFSHNPPQTSFTLQYLPLYF